MKTLPTRRTVMLTSLGKPATPIGPGRLLLVHHILDYSNEDKKILRLLRRSIARLMREGGENRRL